MDKNNEPKGLYGKYEIRKKDGSELDPGAVYFTLRLDTDKHARRAIRAYVESCKEEELELAEDLERILEELTTKDTKNTKNTFINSIDRNGVV